MRTIRNLAGAVLALALLWPGAGAAQDDARGEEIYGLCSQCHGPAGGGNPAALAPSISGLPVWYVKAQLDKFRAGLRGGHPDDIAGMRMRPMSMWLRGDKDIQVIAEYVSSLPPERPEPLLEGGDAERGQQLYATCTACHLADAQGNKDLNAPPLVHASDWYLLRQLSNFKSGIRGADPADTTGILMRPMSMTLPDEQAMKDVIAYIMSLPADGGSAGSAEGGGTGSAGGE